MTKIAIASDVHGNLDALDAVISEKKFQSAEFKIFCGDIIGHYFSVNSVIEKIKKKFDIVLQGNHERMLFKALENDLYLDEITCKYGYSIKNTIKKITNENLEYLKSLPIKVNTKILNKELLVCHGSPLNKDQYIYPDADDSLMEKIWIQSFDILLLGNTHYQMIKRNGSRVIVNPGSIGQPRSGSLGAHWATYDFDTSIANLHVTKYDINKFIKSVSSRTENNPKYLVEVWKRLT